MSYAEVYRFQRKSGAAQLAGTAGNAWGFCMFIWESLAADYSVPFVGISVAKVREPVWDLFQTSRLTVDDRIVLGATFDNAVVKQEDIPGLITAFQSFLTRHPDQLGTITTLLKTLEQESTNLKTMAIGFNATSVNDDAWKVGNRRYNIRKDKGHWDLFKEVKKFTPVQPNPPATPSRMKSGRIISS